jgi:hypothetical protein
MADKDARCCSWAFMFLAWAPDSRTAGELVYTSCKVTLDPPRPLSTLYK